MGGWGAVRHTPGVEGSALQGGGAVPFQQCTQGQGSSWPPTQRGGSGPPTHQPSSQYNPAHPALRLALRPPHRRPIASQELAVAHELGVGAPKGVGGQLPAVAHCLPLQRAKEGRGGVGCGWGWEIGLSEKAHAQGGGRGTGAISQC